MQKTAMRGAHGVLTFSGSANVRSRSAYKVWSRISSEFNKAGVNERGETEELSKIVQRIQEAMENSFPFSVPDEDMLDFEIGTKGILT